MEKIEEVASTNERAKRRSFFSMALAAAGAFALGSLGQIKKVKAQETERPLLIGTENVGDAETGLTAGIGDYKATLHVGNPAQSGNAIVAEAEGGVGGGGVEPGGLQ